MLSYAHAEAYSTLRNAAKRAEAALAIEKEARHYLETADRLVKELEEALEATEGPSPVSTEEVRCG